MKPLRIFMLAALILVVFGVKDVEGEHAFEQIPIQTLEPSGQPPYYGQNIDFSVDISTDGKYVVTGTTAGITLFDRELESEIWNYEAGPTAVSISSNGDYIAGGNNNEIYLFGRASSTPLWSYASGSDGMSLEFSDNGEKLISSSPYNISIFDVSDGDLVWGVYFDNGFYDYDVSADGQYIAICGKYRDPVVYDSNDNYSFSYNSIGRCNSVAISPDGDHIVTISTQQLSELVDLEREIWWREDTAHLNFYSRDNNNTLKTTELDKEVYLDDPSSDFCRPIENGYYPYNPTCYESDIAFSEDGNNIALAFNKMYGDSGNWSNASASLHYFEKNILDSDGPYVKVWNYISKDDWYYFKCAYPKVDWSYDGQDIVYSCGNYYNTLFFFDDGNSRPKWSAGYEVNYDYDYLSEKPIGRWNEVAISADGEFVATIEQYSGDVIIYDNSLPKPDLKVKQQPGPFFNLSKWEALEGENITISMKVEMVDCCHRVLDSHIVVSFYYSDYDAFEQLNLIGNVTVDKDALSSSEQNVSIIWTNVPAGNFRIHVAVDSTNLVDERIESNNAINYGGGGIPIWELPIAIAGNDVTVARGETVQFAGVGSTDDRLDITKYEWDFDADGFYEYESNKDGIITFIYNEEGTHTAIFRITDVRGSEALDSRIITVEATDYQEKEKCVDGDTKIAEDGCNQCICNNEEWVCTEVDCNPDDKDEDKDDDESSLPSVSMIPALISIGLIAIYRRK